MAEEVDIVRIKKGVCLKRIKRNVKRQMRWVTREISKWSKKWLI